MGPGRLRLARLPVLLLPALLLAACAGTSPSDPVHPVTAAAVVTPCDAPAALCEAARWTGARIVYASDRSVYGLSDYQAAPAEALAHGRGDCEDIAAVALARLAALGWPADRAVMTMALYGQDWHAYVVAWDTGGGSWVLGNDLEGKVRVWSWDDWSSERHLARGALPPPTRVALVTSQQPD